MTFWILDFGTTILDRTIFSSLHFHFASSSITITCNNLTMIFIPQILRALPALLLFTVQPVDAGTVTVTFGQSGPNSFVEWTGFLDTLPSVAVASNLATIALGPASFEENLSTTRVNSISDGKCKYRTDVSKEQQAAELLFVCCASCDCDCDCTVTDN